MTQFNSDIIRSLVNGEPADSLSVEDRGLAYGHGVFETMRLHNGVILDLELHLERLQHGAHMLKLNALDTDLVREELTRLVAETEHGIVKLICTNGCGQRGYGVVRSGISRVCMLFPNRDFPDHYYNTGVDVTVCETRLQHCQYLAGVKHLNRLEQVLARSEWGQEYQEGLMLDVNGHVIEATMSNVFCIARGILSTAPIDFSGVSGVKRKRILQTAQTMQVPVRYQALSLESLLSSDEVFLSNSVIGIWPVKKIQQSQFKVGPVTQRLANEINIWRNL